jgi:hypothetical protein
VMPDASDATLTPGPMPEAVIVRLDRFLLSATIVTLTRDGIGWRTDGPLRGDDNGMWIPWHLVGGLTSKRSETTVYGLDGSVIGRLSGELQDWSIGAWLSNVVATYLPETFVVIDTGDGTEVGCIRREVAEADGRGDASSQA